MCTLLCTRGKPDKKDEAAAHPHPRADDQFELFNHFCVPFSATWSGTVAYGRTPTRKRFSYNVDRVYVGYHFRTADVHGILMGKRTGKDVAEKYFQPVEQGTWSQTRGPG